MLLAGMMNHNYRAKTLEPSFPLAMAGDDEVVRVVSMHRGRKFRERLLSMGIQEGDVIKVRHHNANGAVVISKENARFALGGGMALKIKVTKEK